MVKLVMIRLLFKLFEAGESMQLHESGENYLEVMLILNKEKGYIRSVDIANKLSFSKPSVSRAVSILKKAGHIVMDEDGLITLTESGKLIAEKIYERHCFLVKCFKFLGVSDEIAEEDACRIEHVMSQETFEKLRKHFENIAVFE